MRSPPTVCPLFLMNSLMASTKILDRRGNTAGNFTNLGLVKDYSLNGGRFGNQESMSICPFAHIRFRIMEGLFDTKYQKSTSGVALSMTQLV